MKENTYALARNVLRIYEPPYTHFYRQADTVVCLMYITFSERSFDAHVSKAEVDYLKYLIPLTLLLGTNLSPSFETCIIWCSLLSDTVPSKLSGECGLLKPCLRCCTTLRCLYFQLYCARTSFWFIFFSLSLFFKITFLSELKIAYWICLTTYFQL